MSLREYLCERGRGIGHAIYDYDLRLDSFLEKGLEHVPKYEGWRDKTFVKNLEKILGGGSLSTREKLEMGLQRPGCKSLVLGSTLVEISCLVFYGQMDLALPIVDKLLIGAAFGIGGTGVAYLTYASCFNVGNYAERVIDDFSEERKDALQEVLTSESPSKIRYRLYPLF